jgi:hypothetical protein
LESRAFAYEARASTRPAVLQVVERLTAEFAGVHSVGEVIAEAYRARETLLAHGVRAGLVDATEAAARIRLIDFTRPYRLAS